MPQKTIGDALKKGEAILQNVSVKLLEKPAVAKAFEAAMVGRGKVDEGVAVALKRLNVQTRGEFRSLKARVDGLEVQLAELRAALDGLKASSAAVATAKPAGARSPRRARPRKATRKA